MNNKRQENFEIKKLLIVAIDFVIFLLTIFWEPIRKAWIWRNDFSEKYP